MTINVNNQTCGEIARIYKQTDEDSKTRLAIAALGNEAATDASKKDSIISLGKLAVDLFNSWQANQG